MSREIRANANGRADTRADTRPDDKPDRTADGKAKADREPELKALQAALRAEHAAVYGYGVVGGRIGDERRADARTAYDAHRARRDGFERASARA